MKLFLHFSLPLYTCITGYYIFPKLLPFLAVFDIFLNTLVSVCIDFCSLRVKKLMYNEIGVYAVVTPSIP